MKALLARIGLPKAIGLFIEEQQVTLSEVVSGPLGPIEVARHSEPATADELPAALKRLITSRIRPDKARRIPVAVGLPIERTYFATRPIQNPGGDPSPYVLLREALRSADVSVNEMAVDVIRAQPDKRAVASIIACSKRYLSSVLSALRECGIRPVRAEPAPWALLRAAVRRRPARRHAKAVLRLLLGEKRMLAVLVVSDLPIVWRFLDLPRADEGSVIVCATRSLMTVSRDCGIQSDLDAVILHGRPDLARLLDVEWMQQQVEATVDWADGPALDASQVALGLALGCLNRDEPAFDLSHSLKPRPALWELFPLRHAVIQVALVLLMGLFLAERCQTLKDAFTKVRTQNAQYLWMEPLQEAQLQQEKQQLEQKVAAVEKFLTTRVPWSAYQREISACMPANMYLTSFEGVSLLESSGRNKAGGKPQKSLVLRGAVALPENGSIPQEIDRFLNTLRQHPLVKRDFPVVQLTDLKQRQQANERGATASFTIIGLAKDSRKKQG